MQRGALQPVGCCSVAHLKAFSPQGQETFLALDGRLECDE